MTARMEYQVFNLQFVHTSDIFPDHRTGKFICLFRRTRQIHRIRRMCKNRTECMAFTDLLEFLYFFLCISFITGSTRVSAEYLHRIGIHLYYIFRSLRNSSRNGHMCPDCIHYFPPKIGVREPAYASPLTLIIS